MSEPNATSTDEAQPASAATAPVPATATAPAAPSTEPSRGRKAVGQILAVIIIFTALVLALIVWKVIERHPRTDDATVRANVVTIVPRVRGQIVKLHVQDNQAVNEGDLLFEIDPEDYELSLEKAKAALDSLDRQIEAARSQDASLKLAIKVAEATVERARAQLKQADDTLNRLQPLLSKGFTTAEQVDQARTAKLVATAALASEEQHLEQARVAIGTLDTLTAQRPGAVAAVKISELELSYCRVTAPFRGRVINLNISAGAYASAGVGVFALLDARHWYVIAHFREGELGHIAPGAEAEVYLLSAPDRRFRAIVQGIAWAVKPEGEIDLPQGVPFVKRELNWVHIAQRFPVRLEVENPDADLFRMGASAVVTMRGQTR